MLRSISRQRLHPDLLWIGGLLTVTGVLNLLVQSGSSLPVRPILAGVFFLCCPGMALVRVLRLKHIVLELTLGAALSIALTMLTSELLVYGQNWNPDLGLRALSLLVIAGCALQLVQYARDSTP